MRLHQRLVSIFGGIRKAVATHLDEQAINAACRAEKYTWRERLFNPTNTVHLFILQILNRNTALNDLPGIVFFLNSATASQTSWNRPRNCWRKTHSTCQRRASQSSRESIRGTPRNNSAGHWNSAPSKLRSSSSWFAKARNSHCPGQGQCLRVRTALLTTLAPVWQTG